MWWLIHRIQRIFVSFPGSRNSSLNHGGQTGSSFWSSSLNSLEQTVVPNFFISVPASDITHYYQVNLIQFVYLPAPVFEMTSFHSIPNLRSPFSISDIPILLIEFSSVLKSSSSFFDRCEIPKGKSKSRTINDFPSYISNIHQSQMKLIYHWTN